MEIAVRALRPFSWQGRMRYEGDRLSVRPIEAASLTYRRLAAFVRADEDAADVDVSGFRPSIEPDVVVEVEASVFGGVVDEAKPARRRRRYRRRDLTAEGASCDSSD